MTEFSLTPGQQSWRTVLGDILLEVGMIQAPFRTPTGHRRLGQGSGKGDQDDLEIRNCLMTPGSKNSGLSVLETKD